MRHPKSYLRVFTTDDNHDKITDALVQIHANQMATHEGVIGHTAPPPVTVVTHLSDISLHTGPVVDRQGLTHWISDGQY